MKELEIATSAQERGVTWRPLGKKEVLEPLETSEWTIPGDWRCSAIGLPLGDCEMQHTPGSRYCNYHDLLCFGGIDAHYAKNSNGTYVDADPCDVYPVWPLPSEGYVLLEAEEAAA